MKGRTRRRLDRAIEFELDGAVLNRAEDKVSLLPALRAEDMVVFIEEALRYWCISRC
jgi:hypothetical protein